jgi:hypothetical protein
VLTGRLLHKELHACRVSLCRCFDVLSLCSVLCGIHILPQTMLSSRQYLKLLEMLVVGMQRIASSTCSDMHNHMHSVGCEVHDQLLLVTC